MTIILPIMLALCLMLSGTYYAQNYASIIGWCLIYGTKFPFKTKTKNYQELLLLFNVQILFVTSVYTTSNSISVNRLVGLALIQFMIFTLYRLMLHIPFTPLARLKLNLKYFSFPQSPPTSSPQRLELCNTVPEVKCNCKEFQEPLIGQDE